MYQLLGDLRSLFKTKRIHIDNIVLRLHHALTFSVLLACCIVVSTREYAGQPIVCQSDQLPNLPSDLLDSFCWTHPTYVSVRALNAQVGVDVPQPGVAHSLDPADLRHAAYYQWVWVLLFVMALCFYLPQWLWKNYEGGLVERLLKDFELKGNSCATAEPRSIESVVRYLNLTQGTHNSYAFRFLTCELLTLTNVLVQFYLLDRLFDGHFRSFGVDVTRYAYLTPLDRRRHVNPATLLFPKVSKCQYMRFGPSGSLELIDAMCILTVNVMNEKIFLLLWFWFVALIAFTIPTFAFHVALFSSSTLRMRTTISTAKLHPATRPYRVKQHVQSLLVGDWFLLHLLHQNLDPISFCRLLSSYAQINPIEAVTNGAGESI